jgi:hypothetical protein
MKTKCNCKEGAHNLGRSKPTIARTIKGNGGRVRGVDECI